MEKRQSVINLMGVLLLVMSIAAAYILQPRPDAAYESEFIVLTETEFQIVIPEGTGAAFAAGEAPVILHDDILLTPGGRDRLTITNNDTVNHTIGPFFVMAETSLSQQFSRPAVYDGSCSFQGGGIQIIVQEGV